MAFVMLCIQGICLFIIYAVFSTLVAEKRHDIGVLLGIGALRRDIHGAFLLAGIICCFCGGIIGWGVGWGILSVLNPFSNWIGFPLYPQEIIYTPEAPISWNPLIPLGFTLSITVIGALAVFIPALRATRIDPIDSSARTRMNDTPSSSQTALSQTALALEATGLCKAYGDLIVLDQASCNVAAGELVAICGRSGTGKSTLLHALGLLDRPDAGSISLGGQRVDLASNAKAGKPARAAYWFCFPGLSSAA